MLDYIQEAVLISAGTNFIPMRKRYRLPNQTKNASIYLLSNSYEYDIQMIRSTPEPKIDYKNIIIPYRITDRIGVRPFRYILTQSQYNSRITYLNNQKLVPKVFSINYPYPKKIENNLYIPMSDIINKVTDYIRPMSVQFIRDNIFSLFDKVMGWYNYSQTKVLIIDTTKFGIYRNMNVDVYKSDLINALLCAYMLSPEEKIKRLKWIFIFRTPDADYKLDLSTFKTGDRQLMRRMLNMIGTKGEKESDESVEETKETENDETSENNEGDVFDQMMNPQEPDSESSTNELDDIIKEDEKREVISTDTTDGEETVAEIRNMQEKQTSSNVSLRTTLDAIASKHGIDTTTPSEPDENQKLYNAKVTDISTQLMHKINQISIQSGSKVIDTYDTISSEITKGTDGNRVEDELLNNAAKNMAATSQPVNDNSVENTISSPRELKIRQQVGKIKLNNVTFDTMVSITDTPLPKKVRPLHVTTTSKSALAGTSFSNISREYEDKLMDRDIVATFMNMSELPDGFYVTNVEVTDISTSTSLMNNWKVTLKNKQNDRQSVINVHIPRIINGRFYDKGNWFNIGKQDFPIPILKIDRNKVILTTNYQKITVSRYDTRSLVDIGMFTKLISSLTDSEGKNKYVVTGNSTGTNSRFVSTIEYDEYAKQWTSFHNREGKCLIIFDRNKCLKQYQFVSVNQDEFCCGMCNDVPVIINTETGLTRQGLTLTQTMLNTMSDDFKSRYSKIKPGKLSMYSQILIGEKMPLGVAIAAWEGITSLIKRANVQVQYVDKTFSDPKYIVIPFKDKSLAIPNTIQNQLIFNGFYRLNTKAYTISEFDSPIMKSDSVYVDLFNQHFFKQYSQLTLFITYYNFFVDAITKDVCLHYNIPNDICGMLIYASNMLADNGYVSEATSSLYRIRSSEIVPAILHYRLAFAISKYTNSLGSKSRAAKLVFNPNEVIYELTSNVPNVEPLSALNPFVELHTRENISRKGFKGVNDERTFTLDKRSYDSTMVGKMAMSSPNNRGVGITRQLTADPKVESVRGYTSTKGIDGEYNDLQLASWSELITTGTISRDDAIRNAIGTSQTSHTVQTAGSQPSLISNGVDEIIAAHLTDEFVVMAKQDGSVIDMNEDYMIVQYRDKTKQAVNIAKRQSFNTGSGFFVNNQLKPNFKVGDKFKENDILAYHPNHFTKGLDNVVRCNIGPLAKVAFTQTYATYEDAGIVTASFSKKMRTTFSMRERRKIDATDDIDFIVKVGDVVEVGDPLITFGLGDTGDKSVDNFLKAFQMNSSVIDSAKRVVRAKHAGVVTDVKMYTCKSLDKLSPSLYKLISEHFRDNMKRRKILDQHDKSSSVYKMDTLFNLPTEPVKGQTIMGITTDVLIDIYIEHSDEQSVGDKAIAYSCMKQITSEVIPEGLEPFTESRPDEEVSMFVNGGSIMKRMVPSALIVAAGNKCLVELKREMKRIWES